MRPVGSQTRAGGNGLSHKEIAKRLRISKSRVQQLEARALRKLATMLAERGFTFADLGGEP